MEIDVITDDETMETSLNTNKILRFVEKAFFNVLLGLVQN